jgi:L-threonylcarbamoyladenylate synthase
VARLQQVKGRAADQPVSVFLESAAEISRYGKLTEIARRLAQAFLPGPLTLVLEAVVDWHAPLVVNGKIGLRVSPSPVILQLVRLVGAPLTATSANLSGRPGSDTIDAIYEQLGEAVALYLDGGRLTGTVSTVVACDSRGLAVLREGAITTVELQRALNEKDGD